MDAETKKRAVEDLLDLLVKEERDRAAIGGGREVALADRLVAIEVDLMNAKRTLVDDGELAALSSIRRLAAEAIGAYSMFPAPEPKEAPAT